MTLSEFITMLFNYIFSAYLNRVAGTEIVGFYQAGYSLVGRYFGLISLQSEWSTIRASRAFATAVCALAYLPRKRSTS